MSLAGTAVGQQSYRPPVHVPPNPQYDASNRYAGIAAIEANANPSAQYSQNQPAQYARPQAPSAGNRSPHLQARIANAFSNLSGPRARNPKPKRQPAERPKSRQSQQVAKSPTPVDEPFAQYQSTQYQSAQHVNEPTDQQEYVPHHLRNQSVRDPARTQTTVLQRPEPVEQVVQRRSQPNRYPVQPIETGRAASVMDRQAETEQQFVQVGAAPDPYYDRPTIRVTSAQQIEEQALPAIETQQRIPIQQFEREQPVQRVSQTPVYPPIQRVPAARTRPVSILNAPVEGSHSRDPSFGVQEEENDVENNLRKPFDPIQEPEDDIQEEDIDDLIEDEEIPERERQALNQSCEELRYDLLTNPITTIAVDISPPRSELASNVGAEYRPWTDQFGRSTGSGAISTIRRGYAIVESGGAWQKIPVGNMNDADLASMASYWQLPKECTVSTDSFTGRSWVPQTVTWKASNLCHKPLFFENVQLERYGHSNGPFAQPVHSTVHFFTSLALVPYNMGITPANECQYALGFYRPGNCAPWLREPFPISLAGSQYQARTLTAAAFLFFP